MGRNNYVFYLLVFLVTCKLHAQVKEIQGKITNEKEIEGIHILNTTSRYNTITNQNGNFSIRARLNDTLVVSSINYFAKKVRVSESVFENGVITITLIEIINELDEVLIGNQLSGNIATDLKNIKTEKPLNFDDVGIEGFKGKPEEKIVPAYTLRAPTAVNIEALYNYLSGYYRKLRLQRKWEAENNSVAQIIGYYGSEFFYEAYEIPENRLYDFLIYCVETTSLQRDFKSERYALVMKTFKEQSSIYISRLELKEE